MNKSKYIYISKKELKISSRHDSCEVGGVTGKAQEQKKVRVLMARGYLI